MGYPKLRMYDKAYGNRTISKLISKYKLNNYSEDLFFMSIPSPALKTQSESVTLGSWGFANASGSPVTPSPEQLSLLFPLHPRALLPSLGGASQEVSLPTGNPPCLSSRSHSSRKSEKPELLTN